MTPSWGEVWWYEPESAAARPHLVLTRPAAAAILPQILTAPTTRTIREIPSEVYLDPSDGMPHPCVVSLDNVSLAERSHLVERITVLGPNRMAQVCEALRFAVSC